MDLARIHNFFKIYLYRTINLYQSLEASKWDAAFGRLRVAFPPLDRKREGAAANLCTGVRGGSSTGLMAELPRGSPISVVFYTKYRSVDIFTTLNISKYRYNYLLLKVKM